MKARIPQISSKLIKDLPLMDMGKFNLFLKMVTEEYKLKADQVEILRLRLLADDKEFERVWWNYKNKSSNFSGGVDQFKFMLQDLLN